MSLGILAGSASLFVLTWLEWKHPCSQELDTRAAVHSALERFEPIDLAFRLTAAPRGNEVATTCTSRIAMNMPTHIIAKPIDVETSAATGESCSSAFDTAGLDQRGIFGTDPDR
jgi:hypothetical protein